MSNKIKEILNELKSELEKIYKDNLKRLFLYGSHARGEADPDSDIDVLVVLDHYNNVWEEIQRTSPMLSELCLKYKVVISIVPIREIKYNKQNTPLILNVKREGIAL